MSTDDPVRSSLRSLDRPWKRSDHRRSLERELRSSFATRRSSRARRILLTLGASLSLGTLAIAIPDVRAWWEGWHSEEHVLEGGGKRLIVTDPEGAIDFDEVLESDESVFRTEDGEYFVVSPAEEMEVEEAVEEFLEEEPLLEEEELFDESEG